MLGEKLPPQPGRIPEGGHHDNNAELKIPQNYSDVNHCDSNHSNQRRQLRPDLREYLRVKGVEFTIGSFILCPWHDEKTPSCKVNDDYAFCFGCGESGDVYRVAAALIGVPCDKEHFSEIATDVERALGLPEWQPPKRRGRSGVKLSRSEVYRSELLKNFASAIDADDMEQAHRLACLLFALFLLPDGKPPEQKKAKPTLKEQMAAYGIGARHE